MDFTQFPYSGGIINKITYSAGRCAPCHTVGYNDTAQGGYDPAQAWNSTQNIELLGIQCENCHGPGSDHVGAPGPTTIWGRPTVFQSCYGTPPSGGCHGPEYSGHDNGWAESAHNRSLTAAGGIVATNPTCQPCHTREGFINKLEGSTDPVPANPNPIDCATCHDPHNKVNEFQLRVPFEELCGTCHNNGKGPAEPGPAAEIHNPQWEMNQGVGGANLTMSAGMAGVECVDCHMYNTPEVARRPITDFIGGQQHYNHYFEPTPNACVECHAPSVVAAMPTKAKPATMPPTSDPTNRTTWDAWVSWEALYEGQVEQYQNVIDSWQEQTDARWAEVDASVEAARLDLVAANASGNTDPEALAAAWALYYDARWNLDFVEADGSRGVHNFDYAIAMVNDAEDNARQIGPLLRIQVQEPPPQPVQFDPTLLYVVIGLLGVVILVLAAMVAMIRGRLPPRTTVKPETETKE
jgi:predicted CXXCH cytochrome family protein